MRIPAILLALIVTFGAVAQVYELSEVDKAPVFAKGKMKSQDFMRLYQTYPESAFEANIGGTVKLEYIVDASGEVKDIKVKDSINEALNKEAIRVAELFPYYSPAEKDGKAVSVKLQYPVTFAKSNNRVIKDHSTVSSTQTTIAKQSSAPKNPLYVVDGKILEKNQNVNPENIKKIRIVKGPKAINLYGQRAKDGVVMIETK